MFFGNVEINVIWLQTGPAGILGLESGRGESSFGAVGFEWGCLAEKLGFGIAKSKVKHGWRFTWCPGKWCWG